MRIGELLVHYRIVTIEQLRLALQSQAMRGGRLGTHLVALGMVDIDTLAAALAQLLHVPAATLAHFSRLTMETIELLPRKVATMHEAIPLGVVAGAASGPEGPSELGVAFVAPNNLTAVDEVAFATGHRIRPYVAPEICIERYLEQFYGEIPVDRREYRRSLLAKRTPATADPEQPRRRTAPLGQLAAARPAYANTVSHQVRGVYVEQTLTTTGPTWQHAPVPRYADPPQPYVVMPAQRPSRHDAPRPSRPRVVTEARPRVVTQSRPRVITQRDPVVWVDIDVETPTDDNHPAVRHALPGRPALSLQEATTRLSGATSRQEIGNIACDHLRSCFAVGLILIVRDGLALGWKGFAGSVDSSVIESIALPLIDDTMFGIACARRTFFRGVPPQGGAQIQDRLWKLLRCPTPREVLVVPVMIRERIVNLIYAHGVDGQVLSDAVSSETTALAGAMSEAFGRLIRAKSS